MGCKSKSKSKRRSRQKSAKHKITKKTSSKSSSVTMLRKQRINDTLPPNLNTREVNRLAPKKPYNIVLKENEKYTQNNRYNYVIFYIIYIIMSFEDKKDLNLDSKTCLKKNTKKKVNHHH